MKTKNTKLKKIKIGLFGASGKMGQAILQVIANDAQVELAEKNQSPDVWIDFSNHQNLEHVIKMVEKSKSPLICGTTGFSDKDFQKLNKLGSKVAVMWSGNMSFGIQVLMQMLKPVEKVDHCDVQVIEAHHRNKKDAPSGTALMIQKQIHKVRGNKRHTGLTPAPLSIRGGGIFGEHEIKIMLDEETIELKHTALNRLVFARGAVLAAKAIVSRPRGYYTFGELLETST